MANAIRHDIPVREYGIRVFINTLHPIDLTVVCDETQFNSKIKEFQQEIIDDVVDQVKKQLDDIEIGNGIAVVDKRDVNWDKQ